MSRNHGCRVDPAKFGFRHVVVHYGMFEFELLCLVGPITRLLEFVRIQMDDSDGDIRNFANPKGLHFERRGCAPIIWLPKVPRTPDQYGTLAHEVTHVVRSMFTRWTDIPLTFDTDEVYAHAMGHTVKSILEALRAR